jgi:hypothetical protein
MKCDLTEHASDSAASTGRRIEPETIRSVARRLGAVSWRPETLPRRPSPPTPERTPS